MTELDFREIICEAMTEEYKWVPDPKKLQYNYTFSKQFEKEMRKTMWEYGIDQKEEYIRIGKHLFRKMSVVVLAAVILFALASCAIYFGITWSETQNDKQGTLDVNFDMNGQDDASGKFIYKRPEIPDGFTVTAETEYPDILKIEYMNSANDGIDYIQESGVDTMSLSIDNDDESFMQISINGYKGYARTEGIEPYIIWSDGIYLYYLSGSVPFALLLEMAESIK